MDYHHSKSKRKNLNSFRIIKTKKEGGTMKNNSKKETKLFDDPEIFNSFKQTRQMIRDAGLMGKIEYD